MRLSYVNIIFVRAGMSELADEADSKSVDGNIVWVQVPSPALKKLLFRGVFLLAFYLFNFEILSCNFHIIEAIEGCEVILRSLCTTNHLYASVLFQQKFRRT